jgi:hypothetical protein
MTSYEFINIESYGRVAISFLRFQGSRAGLFYDLSARETCPLCFLLILVDREPGLPPQISHETGDPLAGAERSEADAKKRGRTPVRPSSPRAASHCEKTSQPFLGLNMKTIFNPQIPMRSLLLLSRVLHSSFLQLGLSRTKVCGQANYTIHFLVPLPPSRSMALDPGRYEGGTE